MGHASTYFFDASDTAKQTLHKRITPSDYQFEEQQLRWNALADFLVDDLKARSGYPIRTWLQGSYKFATQVRPVHKGEEFDIDLGIYYCWSGDRDGSDFTPQELKQMVQAGLRRFIPLPDANETDNRAANLPAIVMLPEVRGYAVSRDNPNLRYTGVNAIGPLPKNCNITFEVTNTLKMPAGTTFYWMVRNEGEEAEDVNDLGHKAGSGLRATEHSAYGGRHFMDCTAIAGDRIIGLRRVPVTITGMPAPKRNPLKPAYVKLHGRR